MRIRNSWSIALMGVLSCGPVRQPTGQIRWTRVPLPTDHPVLEMKQLGNHLVAIDDRGHILRCKSIGAPWEMVVDQCPGSGELSAAYILDDHQIWGAYGYFTAEDIRPLTL